MVPVGKRRPGGRAGPVMREEREETSRGCEGGTGAVRTSRSRRTLQRQDVSESQRVGERQDARGEVEVGEEE